MVGDVVAQAPDLMAGKPWDMRRTAKMGAFGIAIHGPVGHYWYTLLDRTVMTKAPTSAAAVATKTAIDQIVLAPLFTAGFFGAMKAMDGKSSEIKEEVSSKLWPTMKVNWTVYVFFYHSEQRSFMFPVRTESDFSFRFDHRWPIAHVINFRFVPSSQRILYINTIQIGYNAFLSTMQASSKKEVKSA